MFVDSGLWIAVSHADDGQHAEADRLLREAVARGLALLTTNLVVAECHRLLLFRMGPRAARTFLAKLDASRRLSIEFATAAHHGRAVAWLDRLADQRLSYTDAVSFAVMEARRCRGVLTFDRDFAVAGFRRWAPD